MPAGIARREQGHRDAGGLRARGERPHREVVRRRRRRRCRHGAGQPHAELAERRPARDPERAHRG